MKKLKFLINNMKNFLIAVFTIVYLVPEILTEPIPLEEKNLPNPYEHNYDHNEERIRVRRQYYVCPPDFERISSNCYYFSRHKATWQDAHHECKDRFSDLAVLQTPAEDKKLRGQLNKSPKPLEWWIGGIYDWEQMTWKWGSSGKKLDYHGFSRMGPENKDKLQWHCIILDPTMKYKWSARSCVVGKHYICQKKVMRVNEKGLKKLRKKYNRALNEIPAPIIQKKPRKHQENLKLHQPRYKSLHDNAFAHKTNNTELRRGRKRNRNNKQNNQRKKNRKNRNNKNLNLNFRNNGTDNTINENGYFIDNNRRNRKRNRRNKSKESKETNSVENGTNNSLENSLTQKTTYMTNTLSPLHPRVIIEEHDFLDLINNNNHKN